MSQQKLLVVVGATGHQGSAIINHFLAEEPTFKLRGTTRDKASTKAAGLAARGVEVVEADLDDPKSLRAAFSDATAIFAYTDSVAAARNQEATDAVKAGKAKTEAAAGEEIELRWGRNIADAAAPIPSLERLVFSTITDADKLSQRRFPHVHEMQAKARIYDYMNAHTGLSGKVSGVIMAVFIDNIARFPEIHGIAKVGQGKYELRMPFSPSAPFAWIDLLSDAGSYVAALLQAPAGLTIEAVPEFMTFGKVVALISRKLGIDLTFKQVSLEEYVGGDPTGVMQDVGLLHQWVAEWGIGSSEPDILGPNDLESRGYKVKRTSIRGAIERIDWSAILKVE